MKQELFYSSNVYLSEENSNPNSYIAKFVICDFGRNKNGVALNRYRISEWMDTIKNQPLVGKIKMRYDGTYDFSGHNVKIVIRKDENGNEYKDTEFDTSAFGSFTGINIENVNGVECLVATCEIWKRFTQACEIIIDRIKNGTLHTSWEIAVEESHKGVIQGLSTKIIDSGRFIGHCLLARTTEPAYDSSGLLEIASTKYENLDFSEALSQDILELSIYKKEQEVNILEKDKEVTLSSEVTEETKAQSETTEVETKTNEVNVTTEEVETPDKESTGTEDVKDDEKTTDENNESVVEESEINSLKAKIAELENSISSKDDAIIKSGEEITKLKAEISELKPFKEKFEEAEQKKVAEELQAKKDKLVSSITKSGLITKEEIEKSEELKGFVESLDDKSLKAILAERYIASLESDETIVSSTIEEKETETASVNLDNLEDEVVDAKSIMKSYFGR